MPIGEILAGVGAVGSALAPLVNAGVGVAGAVNDYQNLEWQKEQHAQNMQFQREQFNYMQQQNDLTRQREDNALQRRIADAQAAGIHKTIAAGAAAQAGAATSGNYGGGPPSLGHLRMPEIDGQAIKQGSLALMELEKIKQEINESKSRELLNSKQAGDIEPAAADRKAQVDNLASYQNKSIAIQKDAQTLQRDLAAASNLLTARGLTNSEANTALHARETILREMLIGGQMEEILQNIQESEARVSLTYAQKQKIRHDMDLADEQWTQAQSIRNSEERRAKIDHVFETIQNVYKTIFEPFEAGSRIIRNIGGDHGQ